MPFAAGSPLYHKFSIVGVCVFFNTLESLKKLRQITGHKVFGDGVFAVKGNMNSNGNALHRAVLQNKVDMMKYMLYDRRVKQRLLSDDEELYALLHQLETRQNQNEQMNACVVRALELNEERLNALKTKYKNLNVESLLKHTK
eukprot:CAMPEP_0197050182 /NCGR_PEP_ID=MMETSP1384-20130603/25138_1 /TAXON_ID=29189 /ORGANISM="Ammonia sp." /LENGTH=142 /DNA_ID=CAMNT_0042482553 /DNA_START=42 /DNA_END=470 /DNA_ORIENTATION=+